MLQKYNYRRQSIFGWTQCWRTVPQTNRSAFCLSNPWHVSNGSPFQSRLRNKTKTNCQSLVLFGGNSTDLVISNELAIKWIKHFIWFAFIFTFTPLFCWIAGRFVGADGRQPFDKGWRLDVSLQIKCFAITCDEYLFRNSEQQLYCVAKSKGFSEGSATLLRITDLLYLLLSTDYEFNPFICYLIYNI